MSPAYVSHGDRRYHTPWKKKIGAPYTTPPPPKNTEPLCSRLGVWQRVVSTTHTHTRAFVMRRWVGMQTPPDHMEVDNPPGNNTAHTAPAVSATARAIRRESILIKAMWYLPVFRVWARYIYQTNGRLSHRRYKSRRARLVGFSPKKRSGGPRYTPPPQQQQQRNHERTRLRVSGNPPRHACICACKASRSLHPAVIDRRALLSSHLPLPIISTADGSRLSGPQPPPFLPRQASSPSHEAVCGAAAHTVSPVIHRHHSLLSSPRPPVIIPPPAPLSLSASTTLLQVLGWSEVQKSGVLDG